MNITNYEKCLLKIELMKLKEHLFQIRETNINYNDKKYIEKTIETTIDFINNKLKG